jgi:hypothetical protein
MSDGGEGGDLLQEAREVVAAIMRGETGRGAQTRLEAAKLILGEEYLKHLSDEALVAEGKRRIEARKAKEDHAAGADDGD